MSVTMTDVDPVGIEELRQVIASGEAISLQLPGEAALLVVTMLQMAVRHCDVGDEPAAIAREVCDAILTELPPRAAELLALGWEDDVPDEAPSPAEAATDLHALTGEALLEVHTGICKHCECTEDRACVVDEITEETCHWVGPNLCSACAAKGLR